MSTPVPPSSLDDALSSVPTEFQTRLLKRYADLKSAYLDGSFDACPLRAARFCEIVLRFLQRHLTGKHIAFGDRISNFTDECRKLETLPATAGHESLRIILPRALNFCYTLRNKRGVGHEGGEVDANEIDAATCVRTCDWILCELVRFFHALPLEDAQALLDAVAAREIPGVWQVGGKKRVLSSGFGYKSQVLLLVHGEADGMVLSEDLFSWVEHPRMADFKKDVLRPLHRERLIEYDASQETVQISPRGSAYVERELMPKLRSHLG